MNKLLNFFAIIFLMSISFACSSSDNDPVYDPASITKVSVDGKYYENENKEGLKTEYKITLAEGSDLTKLKLDVSLEKGEFVEFKNDPDLERDLTAPLKINVKGYDGVEAEWTIIITAEPRSARISDIKVNGDSYENLSKDPVAKEYTIDMGVPADLTKIKLDIILGEGSEFVEFTNDATLERDLTKPLEFKIKGEDNVTETFTIKIDALEMLNRKTFVMHGKEYKIGKFDQDKIEKGLIHTRMQINDNSRLLVIHALELFPKVANELKIQAFAGKDQAFGVETPLAISERKSKEMDVLAVINADFFLGTGLPLGSGIIDGRILKSVNYDATSYNTVYGFDDNNVPCMRKAKGAGKLTIGQKVYDITRINTNRTTDDLNIFTPDFSSRTNTNEWGSEAVLEIKNMDWKKVKEIKDIPYMVKTKGSGFGVAGTGKSLIPENGLVLSGNGNTNVAITQSLNVGDEVKVSYHLYDEDTNEKINATNMLGAHSIVLKNSEIVPGKNPDPENLVWTRRARTGIGHSQDGDKIVMIVVEEGNDNSKGINTEELGYIFKHFKADNAVNLDGGGSSNMIINNKPANVAPSNKEMRAVSTMFGIVRKK